MFIFLYVTEILISSRLAVCRYYTSISHLLYLNNAIGGKRILQEDTFSLTVLAHDFYFVDEILMYFYFITSLPGEPNRSDIYVTFLRLSIKQANFLASNY